jgi:hypothetical protein
VDALQIPGVINSTKFLLVGAIWLLIVFAVAGVVSGIDHQWTPPHCVLYTCPKPPEIDKLKTPPFNRGDQCEKLNFTDDTMAGAVLEPENTWSNAFYLLAGMLVLVCTKRPLGYLVGITLCALAAMSAVYHATLQEKLQVIDVAGIYFVLTALLFYGLQATFMPGLSKDKYKNTEWVLGAVLSSVSISGGLFMANHRTKVYMFGSTTFTFTLVCALVVLVVYEMGRNGFDWTEAWKIWKLWDEPKPEGTLLYYLKPLRMFSRSNQTVAWNLMSYFWFFVLIAIPGIACRLLDGDADWKIFCSPKSIIQAHAIWHTFGAATLLIGYDLFAWSGGLTFDYPVFQRTPPDGSGSNRKTLYSTAVTAFVLGAGLLGLSFLPGAFVDDPHPNDTPADPIRTGVTIASVFLLTGLTIFFLRLFHVISDPAPNYKSNA